MSGEGILYGMDLPDPESGHPVLAFGCSAWSFTAIETFGLFLRLLIYSAPAAPFLFPASMLLMVQVSHSEAECLDSDRPQQVMGRLVPDALSCASGL